MIYLNLGKPSSKKNVHSIDSLMPQVPGTPSEIAGEFAKEHRIQLRSHINRATDTLLSIAQSNFRKGLKGGAT
jgi:hypothetical protein